MSVSFGLEVVSVRGVLLCVVFQCYAPEKSSPLDRAESPTDPEDRDRPSLGVPLQVGRLRNLARRRNR